MWFNHKKEIDWSSLITAQVWEEEQWAISFQPVRCWRFFNWMTTAQQESADVSQGSSQGKSRVTCHSFPWPPPSALAHVPSSLSLGTHLVEALCALTASGCLHSQISLDPTPTPALICPQDRGAYVLSIQPYLVWHLLFVKITLLRCLLSTMVLTGRGCVLDLNHHHVFGYIALPSKKTNGKQKGEFPPDFAHRSTPIVVHRKQRPDLSICDFKTVHEGGPLVGGGCWEMWSLGISRKSWSGILSERLSGRKAPFIPASTTFDAVKSIPSARTVHLHLNETLCHTPRSRWHICHLFSTSLWGSVRCHLPTVTRWLPL